MRRLLLLSMAALMATAPLSAFAQSGGRGGSESDDPDKESRDKAKRDREWGDNAAPLPALRNAGPCPFVKALYDAARYVEFKDGREAAANVGFSGEIQGVAAACAYKDDQPIRVSMEVLFELGRGPQAGGDNAKTYRYWVAVTDRNRSVIAKQTFDLPVSFPKGQDRVYKRERIASIVIPRASTATSGSNFEVLVGFEVTPEIAAFNRDGKRFRVNAGTVETAGTDPRKQ